MSEPKGNKPVGDGEYLVKQGDCIISIAVKAGHVWETIWDDPDNQVVKDVRKSPTALLPGDRLHIPELRLKEETISTNSLHSFVRKSIPSEIYLVLNNGGEPRSGEPYTLIIDDCTTFTGETSSDGEIRHPLNPLAKKAKILVGEGVFEREYTVRLGHMDPVDSLSGIASRLNNLGYNCSSEDGGISADFCSALKDFQHRQGLNVSGEPDEETIQALEEQCGS